MPTNFRFAGGSELPVRRELEDAATQPTLHFLETILQDFHPRNFTIELWDGTRWLPENGQFRRFTWKISRPGALKEAILSSNPQVALAEAYLYGDFDIYGDIEAIFPVTDYLMGMKWSTREKLHMAGDLLRMGSGGRLKVGRNAIHLKGSLHSVGRDRQAVRYHYDVSNEFYSLWLDPRMVYSEACFGSANEDLDKAQVHKLDMICRKLRLTRGERFLDIGCGWGGLIMHAAREYGVEALGITLSDKQAEFAREKIRSLGLGDRCEVRVQDYRDLDTSQPFDKLASIGMMEHVGAANLPGYFSYAWKLLRPGGAFLNSAIGTSATRVMPASPTFTDLYIFPDGELVTIAETLGHAEQTGFEVREVQNLRQQYARTLHHWLHRLEAHEERAKQIIGETKYRTWRLYLAGSAYYFLKSWLDLYHVLLVKDSGESMEWMSSEW